MSMDASLKSASALVRHRNVLTRFERLNRLKDESKWDNSKSVYNLPKVANRKMELGKKDAPAEGDAAATPAAAGKAPAAGKAAAGKAAAPAAGAKAAAPAGKGAAPAAKAAAPAAKKK